MGKGMLKFAINAVSEDLYSLSGKASYCKTCDRMSQLTKLLQMQMHLLPSLHTEHHNWVQSLSVSYKSLCYTFSKPLGNHIVSCHDIIMLMMLMVMTAMVLVLLLVIMIVMNASCEKFRLRKLWIMQFQSMKMKQHPSGCRCLIKIFPEYATK